ncbi:MAG: hypothetical protein ACJ8FY_08450 [Gemmataceae bacterium]
MNQTCPTPGCRTAYDVSPRNIGHRFSCKKCSAPLIVGENGVQAVENGAATAVAFEELSAKPPPASAAAMRKSRVPANTDEWRTFLLGIADRSTWLFGAGVFLSVLYSFFPLIDQAKVSRREAAIIGGQLREDRLQADFKKKEKASPDEAERRKKGQEAWEKRKSELEEDVEDAEVDLQRSMYWYRYGMLFGVLLLTTGSLAYAHPSQPLIRRVLGTIILVALIVAVFNSFGRFGFHLDLGGH